MSRILDRRRAGPRRALRLVFVPGDPGAGPRGRRRCGGLSLPRRIDPAFPEAPCLRRHDDGRGLWPREPPPVDRWGGSALFRLAPVSRYVIQALAHVVRLGRVGYVFAREGGFGLVASP